MIAIKGRTIKKETSEDVSFLCVFAGYAFGVAETSKVVEIDDQLPFT